MSKNNKPKCDKIYIMTEYKFNRINQLSPIFSERILRFAMLHTKDSSIAKEMFSDQFVYGHREILLKYAGLDYSNQIIGVIQHGMNYSVQWNYQTPRFIGGKKTKLYVFSRRDQEIAESLGHKHVHAIGAPWLYLMNSLESSKTFPPEGEESVLIMPYHSQSAVPDVSSLNTKLARAKAFRDVIGSMRSTVCLHPVDFLDPNARTAFQEYGFTVTCIGSTAGLAWSPSGGRVTALASLHSLMSRHTHYLTDSVGTSLFYAANMGMKIGIFPKIRDLIELSQIVSSTYTDKIDRNLNYDFIHEYFGNAKDTFAPSLEFIQITNQILGTDSLLDPKALKEVLDYRPGIYPKEIGIEPW